MDDFITSVLSDLIAGLIGTASISLAVIVWSKACPERARGWVKAAAWPIVTFVFFALTASVAILRNATGPMAAGLGFALAAATAAFLLYRLGPRRFRETGRALRTKLWPLLAGLFFLTSLYLLLFDVAEVGRADPVVVAIDLTPEELVEFREVLDELEPELGCKIELHWAPQERQLDRLRTMIRTGAVRWDVVAFDNVLAGAVVQAGVVDDLGALLPGMGTKIPSLVPAVQPLITAGEDGVVRFAPLRANVKVGFYDKEAFAGKSPPTTLEELAAGELPALADGRLVIQGRPGRVAALSLFEAIGGDPRRLSRRALAVDLENLRRLRPSLHPESSRAHYELVNELLIDGQVHLACNWSYAYRRVIEQEGRSEVGVYPGWQRTHILGGEILAIPRSAPHPERATRLIELLLSLRTQRALAAKLRWIPVRLDAHDALPKELSAAVRVALSRAAIRPTTPDWPDIEQALARSFEVLMGPGEPDHDVVLAMLQGEQHSAGAGIRATPNEPSSRASFSRGGNLVIESPKNPAR